MSAKSFLRIINNLQLIAILCILGCADAPENVRGEWKTVMAGDWSAHLYDVHFISKTNGWAVGNAEDVATRHGFEDFEGINTSAREGAESIILHTRDGGQTWQRQPSGVFGKPLRKVYCRSRIRGVVCR